MFNYFVSHLIFLGRPALAAVGLIVGAPWMFGIGVGFTTAALIAPLFRADHDWMMVLCAIALGTASAYAYQTVRIAVP